MSRLVAVTQIDPSPWAYLFPHTDDHIQRLAEDIEERGIQTPLHVMPKEGRYELLAGHARLAAAKLADLTQVPVDLRSVVQEGVLEYVAKDNVLRADVDRTAVAREILRVNPEWSDRRIAACSGVSHPWVAKLRAEAEQAGEVETVTTSDRVALTGTRTGARTDITATAAERIERRENRRPPTPAREVVARAQELQHLIDSAPFDVALAAVEAAPQEVVDALEEGVDTDPVEQREPETIRSIIADAKREFRNSLEGKLHRLVDLAMEIDQVSDDELAKVDSSPTMRAGYKISHRLTERLTRLHPWEKHHAAA